MKKAIVVGATSGIGAELAKILVANGYKVGITGRRAHLLSNLKNTNTENYLVKAFDVTDTDNIAEYLDELTSELGGLDILIISSGMGDINEDLEFGIEKQTIDTNVSGFTAVADWSFNFFQKQKYGHIAAISSIAGIRGSRFAPAYNASKAFQINYLEGLMQKAGKLNYPIIITDIRPGFVDTDMAKAPSKFWVASVNKAAQQIFIAIVEKRKVVYITRRWKFIALLLKVIPTAIYNRM